MLLTVLGWLRIPRTVAQVDRILALIPEESERYRWCMSDACGCMGCVNRSSWHRIARFRLRFAEHQRWRKWKEAIDRANLPPPLPPIPLPPKVDVLRRWGP